jgi:AcrR family transcriptional regulator
VAILAAAAGVVAQRGADATRFADVSLASGVPVSTLQYYFGNREDLLVATFRHVCTQELAALGEALRASSDPWEQLCQLVRVGVADGERSVPTWRTWVEFWRAAMRDVELREEAHGVYRHWRELVERVVRAGVTSGRFASDLDATVVAFQITALVDGIAIPVALADPALARAPGTVTEMVIAAVARLVGIPAEAGDDGS